MHKTVSSLIIAVCMSSSLALSAHEPVPPPPNPEALELAKEMVALMPVETTLGSPNELYSIRREVEKNALAWIATQPAITRDGTLERLFQLKVAQAAEDEFLTAVGEAAPLLAQHYARRLSKLEIQAAIDFLRTEPGRNFLAVQLQNDELAFRLVTDHIYKRIDLPQILLSAKRSRELLGQLQDE